MVSSRVFEDTIILSGVRKAPYLAFLVFSCPITLALCLYGLAMIHDVAIDWRIHALAWSSLLTQHVVNFGHEIVTTRIDKITGQVLELVLQTIVQLVAILGLSWLCQAPEAMTSLLYDWVMLGTLCCAAVYFVGLRTLLYRPFRREPIRVLMVGMTPTSAKWVQRVSGDKFFSIDVVGYVESRNMSRILDTPYCEPLGSLENIREVCKTHRVDRIMIGLPSNAATRIAQVIADVRDSVASVYLLQGVDGFEPFGQRIEHATGIPSVSFVESPSVRRSWVLKSVLDRLFAFVLLVLLLPVFLIAALAIKFESRGPVFFRQSRYGADGKSFAIWKFRSMTQAACGSKDVVQASKNDSRVTRVGAFLRKTSIDELPQLVNVLNGTMSIVGPRPHADSHNEKYRQIINGYMLRHKIKPGMTGLAQINGCRGETETTEKMAARVHFDLQYLRRWSLLLDLYVIVKTPFALLSNKGVY